MKQYIWFLIGIISVSVFYFSMIFFSNDYWFHAEATVIFAALLILIFILYITRYPFPVKVKNIIILIYFVFACLTSVSWIQSKNFYFQQKEYLINTRKGIDDIQLRHFILNELIKTLYKYHRKYADTNKIGEIFKQQIDNDSTCDSFQSRNKILKHDSAGLYISSLTDDEIIIIGESAITGFDEKFPNFSGRIGKMQFTGTLNKDGINYVKNN